MITQAQVAALFQPVKLTWKPYAEMYAPAGKETKISVNLDGPFLVEDLEKIVAVMRTAQAIHDGKPEPDEVAAAIALIGAVAKKSALSIIKCEGIEGCLNYIREAMKDRKEKSHG